MEWYVYAIAVLITIIFFVLKHFVLDVPKEQKITIEQLREKIHAEEDANRKMLQELGEIRRLVAEKESVIVEKEVQNNVIKKDYELATSRFSVEMQNLKEEIQELVSKYKPDEFRRLQKRVELLESSQSNLTAIPYMAAIMADYETYGIENLAISLNWGYDKKRLHKVKSIVEIRKDAQEIVERHKVAEYQLAYLLELFPSLKDVVETEYKQLPIISIDEVSEYDHTRDYLGKEEFNKLSMSERNQLALDRYVQSHNKTKWQIGRDYELYVGYCYEKKGCQVDYFGSFMGLEDLGRDLIVKNNNGEILIIQCKYWSSLKQIHEKHITQLFGTVASYCIENNYLKDMVKGVLITNIELSYTAKKMADYLGIAYRESF